MELAAVLRHSCGGRFGKNVGLRPQMTASAGPAEYFEPSSDEGRPAGGERPSALPEPQSQAGTGSTRCRFRAGARPHRAAVGKRTGAARGHSSSVLLGSLVEVFKVYVRTGSISSCASANCGVLLTRADVFHSPAPVLDSVAPVDSRALSEDRVQEIVLEPIQSSTVRCGLAVDFRDRAHPDGYRPTYPPCTW